MIYKELLEKVSELFLGACIGDDNDGQIIIYTNLKFAPYVPGSDFSEVKLVNYEEV